MVPSVPLSLPGIINRWKLLPTNSPGASYPSVGNCVHFRSSRLCEAGAQTPPGLSKHQTWERTNWGGMDGTWAGTVN